MVLELIQFIKDEKQPKVEYEKLMMIREKITVL